MESTRKCFLLALSLFILSWEFKFSFGSSSRTNPYFNSQRSRSSIRSSNYVRSTIGASRIIVKNESTFNTSTDSPAACPEEFRATGKCNRPIGLDMKKLSLELIRYDILRKLRLDENKLPNVTAIPKEYLTSLLTGIEMQNDSPQHQYDDDHALTEKMIAFSRTRK